MAVTGEPKDDGLRAARVRFAYLFAFLIAFLVIYGTVTHSPIDVSVFGILVGGLVTLLGIEVATALAKAVAVAKAKNDESKDG